MKLANVLLSTFNGEAFLDQQLKSLAEQDYPHLKIYVRDDGSSDSSFEICKQFANDHSNCFVSKGDNIGVFKSYMRLLNDAGNDADYFAFCDQDDVWFADKMSRAVEALENRNNPFVPTMYFSRVLITDKNLNPLRKSKVPKRISFNSALVENIAQGCTIVLNKAARNILIENIPEDLQLHDWWCYLVISASGEIVFDSIPKMLYRMHNSNVSHGGFGWYRKFSGRAGMLLSKKDSLIFKQADYLYHILGKNLTEDKKRLLTDLIKIQNTSLLNRFKILFSNPFKRQNIFDEILLRLYFLLIKKNYKL